MRRDEEETYPMEIRVVVQLPNDKIEEFTELKRKRGLTDHIQTMIDGSDEKDVRVESGSYSDERIDRLEDGLRGITDLLSAVYKNNEADRKERQVHVELMQEQIRAQNEMMKQLTSELGNILNRADTPVPVPVATPVTPQPTGMTAEQMAEMMAMFASMGKGTGAEEVAPVEEVEKGQAIVKKPKKNKRVSAMMDI